MEFNRKFYAANTPGQGGGNPPQGPSDDDLSRAEKLTEIFTEQLNVIRAISELWKNQLNQQAEALDDTTKDVVKSIGRDLYRELQSAKKQTAALADKSSDLTKNLGSSKDIEKKINELKRQQNSIGRLTAELQAEGIILTKEQENWQAQITEELRKQEELLVKQLKIKKQQEYVVKAFQRALIGISNTPFIGGFLANLIKADKVVDEMNKKAAEGANRWKIALTGLDQVLKNITFGLIGLLLKGFETIIRLVIQFNQKTFDLAKNLGTSVEKAGELQQKFLQISATSKNAGLTAKELSETYGQLANTLGFLPPATREFAETATLIQKRIGASAEQMSALAMQSAISGKTLDKTYGTLVASAKMEGARNKLYVTQRQLLEGIAKTSSTVLINFKGSLEALAGAVVRATKLGTTLDQVNKQGDTLLDFETSIAKEFEAQVLTGRDLNLTRARELALAGNTRGLMEELNKQGASYNQFMKMNVIARKAEAEAVGLSVEEYSKILLQQKQAAALGVQEGQSLTDRYQQLMKTVEGQKKLKQELSESELIDLRKASIQDKFNAAMERFKDILGSTLQGPVAGMLEKFIAFVGNTEKMQKLANQVKTVFQGIANILSDIPGIMNSAVTVAKVLASLAIGRAVASMIAAFAGMGPLALGVGAAAAIGMGVYLSNLSGISAGGGTSVGAAGTTDLTGKNTAMTTPINPAVAATTATANTPAQDRSTAAVGTMKETGDVYLDGQKVGHIILGRNPVYGLNKT